MENRFEAVDCESLFGEADGWASDTELAESFDQAGRAEQVASALRRASDGYDAVLVGPWLGVRSDGGAILREAIGKPVGETLSMLAGAAGARFEVAASRVLEASEVRRTRARATSLKRAGGRYVVEHDGDGEPIEGDAVVLACGGMVGGGIAFTPSEATTAGEMPAGSTEPFVLSVQSEACIALDGRWLGRTASLQGPNLEDLAWPSVAEQRSVLERIGVRRDGVCALDREARVIPRLFVAGSVGADVQHTTLCAMMGGIEAGLAAARA
jgi:glycerol-3-phosphate dehydrogenase subunit B